MQGHGNLPRNLHHRPRHAPADLCRQAFRLAWDLPAKAGRGNESVLRATVDQDAIRDRRVDLYRPVLRLDGQVS